MSADLFAEFNDLSSRPPQQQQSSGLDPQVSNPASRDPFGSLQGSNAPAPTTQQRTQPWSSFQNQQGGLGAWGNFSTPTETSSNTLGAADDDDAWGDFEVAEPSATNKPVARQRDPWQTATKAPPPSAAQGLGQTRPVRASTMDIMTNNLVDIGGLSSAAPAAAMAEPKAAVSKSRPRLKEPTDPSVLFDAQEFELEGGDDDENEDGDDEFGDFETVPPAEPKPNPASTVKPEPPPPMDLLSLDDPPAPRAVQDVRQKAPTKLSGGLGFGATATRAQRTPQAVKAPTTAKSSNAAQTTIAEDEEWEAWDDFEPAPRKNSGESKKTQTAPTKSRDSWDWDAVDTPKPVQVEARDDEPPPINVPPPSVLLSAFPTLLSSGDALFKPMTGQNASIKQRILFDPKAVEFLHGYILIATTAARVIAGRKHRWHRDKILAKSMSISAAGSKGMKLAGVDKTQSAREDRESADVAAVWRDHVGRLRSAVAAANSSGKTSLKVPDINENMQVQTAKLVPTAPKPCVICGLKRDERVAKVDFEVEDSFGEWWVDHWGHRACKSFWVQHEKILRQR